MMNDSVREELQTKIGGSTVISQEPRPVFPPAQRTPQPIERPVFAPEAASTRRPEPSVAVEAKAASVSPEPKQNARVDTAELNPAKTSPTLVEFQPKNAIVPDWRLQLQNAVRHRKVLPGEAGQSDAVAGNFQKQLVTNGSNALKPEYAEVPETAEHTEPKDPRLANALKRISESRMAFMPEPRKDPVAKAPQPQANKNFPFNVVHGDGLKNPLGPESRASVNVLPKPRLVSSIKLEKKDFDTNKLPPIPYPTDEIITSIEMKAEPAVVETPPTPAVAVYREQRARPLEIEFNETDADAIEDLAPFSMRFNAGIFDLIIGGFASLVILSPIALIGGEWISAAGVLTFISTCAIVMFLYLTVCLGLFGKTFGMRMFALELVDADENDYPTFNQAAVSSAAYLLSLPFFGLGFVTIFFNDEKRAAHDLLSGTIIVNEF